MMIGHCKRSTMLDVVDNVRVKQRVDAQRIGAADQPAERVGSVRRELIGVD
jgi:hypothetical protein